MILSTRQLSLGYPAKRRGPPTVVAENISESIRPGEFICLVGPNGAGKSTLLRTLAGLQDPLAGHVALDDRDIRTLSGLDRARAIAVVLTERSLPSDLRVHELVSSGRHPHTGFWGQLDVDDERIIRESLSRVGASAFTDRMVGDLSDGERQRVMIARALAQEPWVLVLDEVTAFLDLPGRVQIMTLLRNLSRERQCGIILSSHDLELSLQLADSVWLMRTGGSIQSSVPEDLALSGALNEVFDTTEVKFRREAGSFGLCTSPGVPIQVLGEGLPRAWTERALLRAGYTPAPSVGPNEARVIVEDGSPQVWSVSFGGPPARYGSIAGVLAHLTAGSPSPLKES